jgi:hypothetical protein
MNMFSRVVVVMVALAGSASAQPKPEAKPAVPAPAAPVPAPAAKPAAPAAPVTKPAAPAGKPAAPVAKPAAPVARPEGGMAEMKPAPELAEMAKIASGTWRCKGQAMDHAMKQTDASGTLKAKAELDGFWLHNSFEAKIGKEPFHFESYDTFDPTSRTWKRVMVESGGGWSTGESAGLKDGKVDWELTAHSPHGEGMFRDHLDLTDAKAGAKMWGEFSPDKGKTWTKVYEMLCKK